MSFSRKIKLKSNAIVSSLIALGIIIVINIISYQWFYRIDLTQNKEFSISSTTKHVLGNLKDIVNVKVYFSEKLPPQYAGVAQETKDVLDEYRNFSHGNLQITYIDPKDDQDLSMEAQRLGIPPVRFNILEKDQFQASTGFLGLAIMYGDKKEVLPVIEDTGSLEYKLTAAITKVTSDKIGKVGFVKGHGEPSAEEERPGDKNMFREILRQQFDVVSVDTKQGDSIDDSISTLVINGPKEQFTDRELYLIDQFLMKGKSVMFLVDGVSVGDGLKAEKNQTNLEKLLASYGVSLENNLVLDASNEMVSFNDGRSPFSFFVPYPFWVKAVKGGLDEHSVIVQQIESLLFPWVSSLTIDKNIVSDNEVVEIVKSSSKSWTQTDKLSLDPSQKFAPTADELKQRTLGVFIKGKFDSYFAGKPVPAKEGSAVSGAETAVPATQNGRIIVVGDSDFITGGILDRSKNNLIFFQNMIDVLTQDENLVSIRAKDSSDRPIKEVSDKQRSFIKFANIFGITILVIVAGVIRFSIRRRDDKREF